MLEAEMPEQSTLSAVGTLSRPKSERVEDRWITVQEKKSHKTPVWDVERRELRLGNEVIKHFRWPAQNQEAVSIAFQSLGFVQNRFAFLKGATCRISGRFL